jgi:hypothetical protein
MTDRTIGPDTTLWVWVADTDGWTLRDSILGAQTSQEWLANQQGSEQEQIAQLAEWIGEKPGFYLSEREASPDDADDAPELSSAWLIETTPRRIYHHLCEDAQNEQ